MKTYSVLAIFKFSFFLQIANYIHFSGLYLHSSLLHSKSPAAVKMVSSANILGVVCLRQFGKSSIHRLKRRGPSILPWGMPQVIFLCLESISWSWHF